MRYENGKIIDVTIEFPDIIMADAENRLEFSRTDGDHQGVGHYTLAVYIYNMHHLGKLDEARPQFDQFCNELADLRKIDDGGTYCQALWDEVIADIQKYEQTNTQE